MSSESRPLGTTRTLLRLYPFAGRNLWRIGAGALSQLVGAAMALLIPLELRNLVNGPISGGDQAAIWPVVLLVLALGIIEAVMILMRRLFAMAPSMQIETDMRDGFYNKLQDLPVAFHDGWPSGQLLSRMYSDLSMIRRFLAFGLMQLVVNICMIVGGFVVLVLINPVLGVIFIVASIPIWVIGFRFHGTYQEVARLSQDQAGDLATSVEESVHGIRVLKAFGRGPHALHKFTARAEELRDTELQKARAVGRVEVWLHLVPDGVFALSLLAGVVLAALGLLTVGDVVAFFATAAVLRYPVESVGMLLAMVFDTRTAVDRYFEVVDEQNAITDPAQPVRIVDPAGRLAFEDVHFAFADSPPGYPEVLRGVDLVVEPGETMALVGLTGSGKTTMTALSTRLYEVTGGRITLDGVDIRDLTREDLRTHLAMAFEDATLFSASVKENVLLGRPDGGDTDLAEALGIAQADFAYALPDGVATVIGEEGMSLSGGQRQRLALARAVAARPAVLVLDDPLSALDVDTEALVEAALRRVLARTTALVVAHRPSTVQLADRVALLQDGRITAIGTHSQLLATNEHYRYVISSLEEQAA
jgi:ATP-binding cassette subfamily B protein